MDNQRCDATAANFLTNVDTSCCKDQDCTDLPKTCTEECANTYMPFFSRCGRHVFGTDATTLAKFEVRVAFTCDHHCCHYRTLLLLLHVLYCYMYCYCCYYCYYYYCLLLLCYHCHY